MKYLIRLWLLSGCLAGCAGKPFDPSLTGRTLYVCCNLRFNSSNQTNDANYWYADGTTLAPGTPVEITKVTHNSVTFTPPGGPPFLLGFGYGGPAVSANGYFHQILVDSDPQPAIAAASPEVRNAIRDAHVVPGMTKDQVVLSRGYPPRHRTPSLDADTWMYFISGSAVQQVHFVDGQVSSVDLTTTPP